MTCAAPAAIWPDDMSSAVLIQQATGEFYYLKGLMRHNHSSSIEYFEKAERCLRLVERALKKTA